MSRLSLLLAATLAVSAVFSIPSDAPAMPARHEIAASPVRETRLGDAPVSIELPIDGDRLAPLIAQGHSLRLDVEGLQALQPGAVYQVYLDLGPDAKPDPKDPSYIGNISLSTEPGQTPDLRLTWDVTGQLKTRHDEGWKGPVRVTFVRERLDPAETDDEPTAFLRFTRVALVAGR